MLDHVSEHVRQKGPLGNVAAAELSATAAELRFQSASTVQPIRFCGAGFSLRGIVMDFAPVSSVVRQQYGCGLLDNQTTYIFTLDGTKAHIQVPAAPLMLPLMSCASEVSAAHFKHAEG
jgi:hypothetical protein